MLETLISKNRNKASNNVNNVCESCNKKIEQGNKKIIFWLETNFFLKNLIGKTKNSKRQKQMM